MAEYKYIIHQNDSIVWNDSDTKDPIFTLDEAASRLLKFPLNTVNVYRAEEIKPTIVIEAAATAEDSSKGTSAGASAGASAGTSTKQSESTSSSSTSTTTPVAGA